MKQVNTTNETGYQGGYFAPLKKATLLSKYFTFGLFIILPFLGGWVGYNLTPVPAMNTNNIIVQNSESEFQYSEMNNKMQADLKYNPLGGLYFYNRDDGLIYFLKTEIEDKSYVLIAQADTDTFSVYKETPAYAHDKNFVYFIDTDDYFAAYPSYKLNIIEGADPESFKTNIVEAFPVAHGNTYQSLLAKDNNNIYYKNQIIEGADPESFVVTKWVSINYDKNYVFLWRKIIPNADPSTYKVLFDTSTSKKGVVFGYDANECFKDYEVFDCAEMPTNFDEAIELSKQN
jgi:hypothetical protein